VSINREAERIVTVFQKALENIKKRVQICREEWDNKANEPF
jgi:hypothetical protein